MIAISAGSKPQSRDKKILQAAPKSAKKYTKKNYSIPNAKGEELIIADGLCPDISRLLSGALHEVISIGQCDHPIAKITSILEERRSQRIPVKTLHIFAHGARGAINLAGNTLNKEESSKNAKLISK